MADAEGVIGELKTQGTADRVQRRRRPHFHVQLLLNCTAVNCKGLADHAHPAQTAAAAQSAKAQPPAASAAAADRSGWLSQLLAATPSVWDYPISLN